MVVVQWDTFAYKDFYLCTDILMMLSDTYNNKLSLSVQKQTFNCPSGRSKLQPNGSSIHPFILTSVRVWSARRRRHRPVWVSSHRGHFFPWWTRSCRTERLSGTRGREETARPAPDVELRCRGRPWPLWTVTGHKGTDCLSQVHCIVQNIQLMGN